MYELMWKSEGACRELFQSEYFSPKKKSSFVKGSVTINACLMQEGIYFEEVQKGEVISTHYLNKKGVESSTKFV